MQVRREFPGNSLVVKNTTANVGNVRDPSSMLDIYSERRLSIDPQSL